MSERSASDRPDPLDDDAVTPPQASDPTGERVIQGDPDPSPEPAADPDFDGVDITQSDGPVLEEGPDLS